MNDSLVTMDEIRDVLSKLPTMGYQCNNCKYYKNYFDCQEFNTMAFCEKELDLIIDTLENLLR